MGGRVQGPHALTRAWVLEEKQVFPTGKSQLHLPRSCCIPGVRNPGSRGDGGGQILPPLPPEAADLLLVYSFLSLPSSTIAL